MYMYLSFPFSLVFTKGKKYHVETPLQPRRNTIMAGTKRRSWQ